ncbi:MAG: peptidoglycan editing factor PgeF [Fusicatenibacter sp.]|nr:peptidoglycan editing factor PgeF [Fusicatenibacter sp.]
MSFEIRWHMTDAAKMKVNETGDGIVYLTWPELEQTGMVTHAFTTRLGGVSEGFLSSMNLSYTRGDDPCRVDENFRRISRAVGFEVESIVTSDQTHTTNVQRVGREDCGSGITRPRSFHDVDGLITDEPGVTLATFYADCVPLYFVDPVHRAIGLSHSGWRGTVNRMGQKTIDAMGEAFGTRAEDLITAIGPSICQNCYEVSEDVIDAFRQAFPKKLHHSLFYAKEDGKYQLNLWEANRQILIEANVADSRILLPNLCTCCNPGFLFSHRASKGKRGNLAAFLSLNE